MILKTFNIPPRTRPLIELKQKKMKKKRKKNEKKNGGKMKKKVRKTKNEKRKTEKKKFEKKSSKIEGEKRKKKLFLGDTSELRHGRNGGLKIGAGWRKNLKQKPKKKGLKVFF
jgi:hypothetical protein